MRGRNGTGALIVESPVPPEVRFARPYAVRLRAEGLSLADMHFHTTHTDGSVPVPSLVRRIRKTGIGCAVTDHNEISGALAACREGSGLLVIPGIEVSTADGPHILVYFYTPGDLEDFFVRHIRPRRRESPWMLTTLTSSEVLDAAGEYSCLRGMAHPYGYLLFNSGLGKCVEKGYLDASLYGKCDLVEGICANMARRENLRAIALATRLGLPMTGGSDGHVIFDHGSAVACTGSEDPSGFLDELRAGRGRVVGKENHIGSKMVTAAVITARFMPWLCPSARIHCERLAGRVNRFLSQRLKRKDESPEPPE